MRLFAAIFLAIALVAGCSSDGPYPSKTVTIICPWAAGGGTDDVSRFWAGALEKELGGTFVVQNKTGGSGNTGHSAGAKARPDGYTMTTITFELCTMHRMDQSTLTHEDFRCILQMNADPAAIIVRQDAPWASLREFLDEIDSKPGELSMSGTSAGGAWDLARFGLLLAADLPVDAVKWVPTEGARPSLVKLIGGHVDAVCCSVPEAAPQIASGELRVLTVMSEEPLDGPHFEGVPTAKQAGVDWVAVGWRGLAVPKDTPDDIVDKLSAACLKIAESDEFKSFMQDRGFGIKVRGPDEFTKFLQQQDAQWKPVCEAFLNR